MIVFMSCDVQGLRIAPPEAPVTGYMFGKGIYFADMVSKSANYCCTNKTNNTGQNCFYFLPKDLTSLIRNITESNSHTKELYVACK
jgi:Poly(ADP-ribose) polymerase catalytic domain